MMSSPGVEYAVYTFDIPAEKNTPSRWNKDITVRDAHQALAHARTLLETRKFMKIEIKKKFYDPKTNTPIAMTFKTLEQPHPGRASIFFAAILMAGGVAAALFFMLG